MACCLLDGLFLSGHLVYMPDFMPKLYDGAAHLDVSLLQAGTRVANLKVRCCKLQTLQQKKFVYRMMMRQPIWPTPRRATRFCIWAHLPQTTSPPCHPTSACFLGSGGKHPPSSNLGTCTSCSPQVSASAISTHDLCSVLLVCSRQPCVSSRVWRTQTPGQFFADGFWQVVKAAAGAKIC